MKDSKEELFKAFGELLYAVASADGNIQQEEKALLAQVLSHHNYAFEIVGSFKFLANTQHSISEAYKNALKTFKAFGYFEGYAEFKIILEDLAFVCEGISAEERMLIDSFIEELNEHFKL